MPTNSTFIIPDNIDLRENNPYSIGSIRIFPEGDFLLERDEIKPNKSFRDRFYTVVKGDTLSSIAFDRYGNSKWWWIIKDSNPNILDAGFELIPGTGLLIPDLDKLKVTSL